MNKFNWKSLIPHTIAVAIFLVIAAIYCEPALEGKVLQQSDIIQWKGMAAQSFKYKETHGHFPLWTNSMFGGMPAYQIAMDSSNPVSIAYLHYLFTLFLPKPINFFFLMCVSFYFLTQVLKVDYRLGILGGIAYAYASFTSIIVAVGHDTQALALGYVPALLGSFFMVFQKKYWVGGALSGIFASLLIAQDHPQVAYYFIIVAVFASIAYLIQWVRNKEYKHIFISCFILIAAGTLGAGVSMVTLATTLDFSKATMRNGTLNLDTTGNGTRQSSGLPIDYAFQWSYGQVETFTLLVPDIYGGAEGELGADSHLAKAAVEKGVQDDQAEGLAKEMSAYWGAQQLGTSGPVYVGAIMCFLFIFGLIYLKGIDKWWMLAACIMGIFMSWGSHFMAFNQFLFNNMPLYNKFRAPTMSLVIPQLLFPLLGVMALNQFIFKETDKVYAWKKLKIAGFVMGGIFVILLMMYAGFDYKADNDLGLSALAQMTGANNEQVARSLFAGLKEDRQAQFGGDILRSLVFAGLAFLALWLLVKNKIKPVYALVALVLLGSIDTLAESRRYFSNDRFMDVGDEATVGDPAAPSAVDQDILRDSGFYRVFNMTRDYFNDALTSYHHNSVGGYSPAKLSIVEDLLNYQLRGRTINPQVLNMLNVKYIIVSGQKGQPVARQNPAALGNCWFVKAAEFVNGPAAAMKALNEFNPRDTAVIENKFKQAIPFTPITDSTASIKLDKNDNDVITYTSNSKTNQLAVFSEIYYDRGWKAYVDGKEYPIIQADYVLRALALPAGNHSIRFEFKPASYYKSSAFAFFSSVIILLSVIAAVLVTIKNKPQATA